MRRLDDWLTTPPRTPLGRSLMQGLDIASQIYDAGVRARTWAYRSGLFEKVTVDAAVVSIGNVTVGGTGKTPLTICLARELQSRGRTPAIVSRGYLKKGRGLVIVSDTEGILAGRRRAGDEPYLMARALPGVPVVVGPNRALASLVAVGRFKPDVILMDDAFQHLKIQRDLDVVVIDSTDAFGNGMLLPRGLLREPPKHLGRADVIVLTRVDQCTSLEELKANLRDLNEAAPIVETVHRPAALTDYHSGAEVELAELNGMKVAALSGIGNPKAFERTLAELGADVIKRWRFPNHHVYRRSRLSDMVDRARDAGAKALITTEKDMVRFPAGFGFHMRTLVLGIELEVVAGADHLERIYTLERKG